MAAIELFSTPLFSDANISWYSRFEDNSVDEIGTNDGVDTDITYNASYGKFNKGASFNGSTSKIVTGSNCGITGNAAFTLSCWVYFSDVTTDYIGIMGIGNFDIAFHAAGMLIGLNNGSIGIGFAGANNYLTAASTVTTGQWYHVVITKTAGAINTTTHIYVNGSEVANDGSPSTGTPDIADHAIEIGGITYAAKFSGYIDDPAIFTRALTATEVSNLYTGTWPAAGGNILRRRLLGIGL